MGGRIAGRWGTFILSLILTGRQSSGKDRRGKEGYGEVVARDNLPLYHYQQRKKGRFRREAAFLSSNRSVII